MSTTLDLIDEILSHRTHADDEGRLLELIASLRPDELNELLHDERADRLYEAMDNHLFGAKNHDALIELLAVQRLADLDLHARASVIYAAQTGRTGSHGERLVRDLLLGVKGEELTRLKNIINLRNDQHDLEGLVFLDIDDEQIRTEILDHFAAQAEGVEITEAKILSDIDDTVFCKLHDKRYPKGTLYPGVLAFQEALDKGPRDDPKSLGDLTFVTARPMDFFGLVENHSRASLKQAGIADLSVMSGSLFSLHTHDAMAGKKVENVTHYVKIFPEYRLTFMGDSGQGDVQVGERLWELYPGMMDPVYIHDVTGVDEQARTVGVEQGIWFHDTYVGAATKAFELDEISGAGLQHVIDEAMEDLTRITWDDEEQRATMDRLFDRDIAAARTALTARGFEAR